MATLGLGQPDIPTYSTRDRWWKTIGAVVYVGVVLIVLIALSPFVWIDGKLRGK